MIQSNTGSVPCRIFYNYMGSSRYPCSAGMRSDISRPPDKEKRGLYSPLERFHLNPASPIEG